MVDHERTVAEAYAPVVDVVSSALLPVLGIFVHQGAHYTGIIRRNNTLYHLDSRPLESGDGHFVY